MLLIGSAMAGVYVLDRFLGKAPPPDETGYTDGVIRAGVIATVFWGVVGFLVGVVIAWQLAFPALNLDLEWTSFGRLRPLHTSAVIFAFGGNALIATSFYVVQRTCRARLGRQLVALVRLLGLPALHRAGRHRLSARRHPVEGVRRARMVRRSLADHRLGRLSPRLRRHARAAPRAAHLRRQLVLSRLHRHHRHAAHRQQPGDPRLAARLARATSPMPASRTP